MTVVQYCVDMSHVLKELSRVLTREGRAVLVVGRESRVLGVPFYNADIIDQIATQSGLFEVTLRQKRVFANRFGESIQEDILNLVRMPSSPGPQTSLDAARRVASTALENGLQVVSARNKPLLLEALCKVGHIEGTPVFDSLKYEHYQTRELVLMVKEGRRGI